MKIFLVYEVLVFQRSFDIQDIFIRYVEITILFYSNSFLVCAGLKFIPNIK